MTRRIQVQNFKGGCGKTTTAIHCAHGLALRGKRVLLIDLDHQANATKGLGVRPVDGQPVFYHMMVKEIPYHEVMVEARPNLFLLPSNELTSLAESHIAALPARELFLFNRLESAIEFDYIIVDCTPALSVFHNNALLFAEEMIITVGMEAWSVDGGLEILKSAARMRKFYHRQPDILGVLPWKIDLRTSVTHTVQSVLGQSFGSRVLPAIRSDETFKKAAGEGKTVFEFAPRSKGAQDYSQMIDVVLSHESELASAVVAGNGVNNDVTESIFAA